MNAVASRPPELDWLIRLRWAAVIGISAISGIAVLRFTIELPWALMAGCLLTAVGSNLWASHRRSGDVVNDRRVVTALVLGDIPLLTLLLYYTGGAHNPFTVLYLLHITLAVMLLDNKLAWFAVGLCGACFGWLFGSPHMLVNREGTALCSDINFHLQGMLWGIVVTGGGVVYFVGHLNRSLVTQRALAEEARRAAEREQRFASLVTMAAGVAHELASPLATIAVAGRELELSAQCGCRNEECLEDIKLIRQEVDRCREILDKLGRDAMAVEPDPPELLRPNELPHRLSHYLPSALSDRIKWNLPTVGDPVLISADPLLRSMALLIKNAFEASAANAPVEVSLAQLANADHPNSWRLTVRDQGIGMSDEQQERLGEPFFTTKPTGAGMGLGFFLARALIAKLGGQLEVQSQIGQGTTAVLTIPLTPNPPSVN